MSAPDDRLPLIVFPRQLADDSGWAAAVRACADRYLSKLGSILFRGFPVRDDNDFYQFVRAFENPLAKRASCAPFSPGRRAARPASEDAPAGCSSCPAGAPHSECVVSSPRRIFFHCARPPAGGGESLIVDNRAVYRRVPAALRARLAERGLLYVRNFDAPAGTDWTRAFGTGDRRTVEAWCREREIQFEWKTHGGLRIRRRADALTRHPLSDERLWWNQLHLFHSSLRARGSLRLVHADRDAVPRSVYYGDGAAIEAAVVEDIRAAYAESASVVHWEAGDVLLLDNYLTAHAHGPSARRSVRTALSALG